MALTAASRVRGTDLSRGSSLRVLRRPNGCSRNPPPCREPAGQAPISGPLPYLGGGLSGSSPEEGSFELAEGARLGREETPEVTCPHREEGANQAQAAKENLTRQVGDDSPSHAVGAKGGCAVTGVVQPLDGRARVAGADARQRQQCRRGLGRAGPCGRNRLRLRPAPRAHAPRTRSQ
jgi:hypothetical protein